MRWTPALEPRLRECVIPGCILIALMTAALLLSHRFVYGSDMLSRPIISFTVVMIIAGIVYLVATVRIHRMPNDARFVISLFIIGLAMRALMLFSTPVLEDDYYRYLWEGGMVANGYSPYRYAPDDANWDDRNANAPAGLIALGAESATVHDRVNHSTLSTVYPPVAQAAFTAAHFAAPWNLTGWRILLLLADIALFVSLLLILHRIERPLSQSVIYWWNPILIKESMNSAHMDVIVGLFIVLAVLCIVYHRLRAAGIALAFAAATKLWPLILAPFFLRHTRALREERGRALIIATVTFMLLMLPILTAFPFQSHSGFTAYTEYWEMNDALFMGILKATELATNTLDLSTSQFNLLARAFVALVILAWIFFLQRRSHDKSGDFLNHLVLATGLLFMLSPTQFPWYYIWLLPLLALSPRPSYLILTVTLPLYYLKFYFVAHGNDNVFHHGIVWIEFLPTVALLVYEHVTYKLEPAEYAGIINA